MITANLPAVELSEVLSNKWYYHSIVVRVIN